MRLSLLQLVLCYVPVYLHLADTTSSRFKRANRCGQHKFQCKDEACIDIVSVCDGVSDCADGSDEDKEACFNVLVPAVTNYIETAVFHPQTPCPQGTFQCTTGECIDVKLKCNGKADCQDGADEHLPECPSPPPTCSGNEFQCTSGLCVPVSSVCNGINDCSDGSDELRSRCGDGGSGGADAGNGDVRGCTYPPKIENGKYKVVGCESCIPAPGKLLQEDVYALQYTCDPGFELKGESVLFCNRGKWTSSPPTCNQLLCPKLTSESIFAECTINTTKFTCDWPAYPGTKAVVRCKAYYVSTSIQTQTLKCGLNGQWNDVIMKCNPACGKDRSGNNRLVANGKPVKEGYFPWHVGLYKQTDYGYAQICGGSLISQSFVLTAAHCVWNNARTEPYPAHLYRVIAGKFHRSYTTEDTGQQERMVQQIDIPPFFSGVATYFRNDIAVLTVDSPFELTEKVRPVCVDWDNAGTYYVAPGDKGQVAGWGITEKGEPSEELLFAEFPVIEYSECLSKIDPNYQNYFGSDKICAGYRNGTTVCNGDSGGGLSFIYELNPLGVSTKLYFVQGIVSTSGGVYEGDCNLKDYVAFTRVASFKDFLEKYRPY